MACTYVSVVCHKIHIFRLPLYYATAACATSGNFVCTSQGMSMCVAYSIARPAAQFNNVSFCPLAFIPNISGLLRPGIKPGPPACQSGATSTMLSAPLNKIGNLGTIYEGSHFTQVLHVPHIYRIWHRIHTLALIHSTLYMTQTTLRSVVNFLSFRPMLIRNIYLGIMTLTFVLPTFITLHSATDVSFRIVALYTLCDFDIYNLSTATPRV